MTPLRIAAACSFALFACASAQKPAAAKSPAEPSKPPAEAAVPSAGAANPFFEESPLPLRYPQFDKIGDGDFVPAFEAGMARHLEEIRAIARDPAAPTFENTFVALERAGRLLRRVGTAFSALSAANTDPELTTRISGARCRRATADGGSSRCSSTAGSPRRRSKDP